MNNIKSETELFEKFETIIETEKIQNLIDETINNINNVLEIPTIEITVYENKQQTIRNILNAINSLTQEQRNYYGFV